MPTTGLGAMVVLPDGSRAPSGPDVPFLPSMDRPADATGGLCIGRSCADALGGLGAVGHQQAAPVYTGALLATTIKTYEQGLNIGWIGDILEINRQSTYTIKSRGGIDNGRSKIF